MIFFPPKLPGEWRSRLAEPPVIYYERDKADLAFEVHQALMKAEADNPSLRENPFWAVLRSDAYGEFCRAFARAG